MANKRQKLQDLKEDTNEAVVCALYAACVSHAYDLVVEEVACAYPFDLTADDMHEVFLRTKQFVQHGSLSLTPEQYAPHLTRFLMKRVVSRVAV